ncbi:TetR/AcrR family transcriptional regulator [Bacillus sp. FJAT-49732]|uniref:TetR/AcrR family transcriptional regulator n=1 Tax=Lederbergia citrisecunda TaxID=2833583 RepID=A0A942TLQ3_9BACI|nr:TetR/AcrR family transcriptional regulator [Lederbergia citrisecunda]MBS4198534.1 TetR/AcrR family transcriptional regulator [Lederbergia citrisecunda]
MSIDRKRLIIEAATKSFAMFGYKATSMDQVAKIANVGKGTIYTFFTNKEELLSEIVNSLIKEMKAAAEETIQEELSFFENVNLAIYELLKFRKQHQLTIKLFQEEREIGTPAVKEMMDKVESAIVNYIKDKVVEAIEKGEIRKCDPEITAFIMLKMYISLIFDWEKSHKPLDKEKISELFKFYLFTGLSK